MYHEGATIISRNYLPQRNNVPIVEKRLIAENVRPRDIVYATYDLNCNREDNKYNNRNTSSNIIIK